jgi:hypothetical protein
MMGWTRKDSRRNLFKELEILPLVSQYIPYFSVDNARVIYTKKFWIRKEINMRGIH